MWFIVQSFDEDNTNRGRYYLVQATDVEDAAEALPPDAAHAWRVSRLGDTPIDGGGNRVFRMVGTRQLSQLVIAETMHDAIRASGYAPEEVTSIADENYLGVIRADDN